MNSQFDCPDVNHPISLFEYYTAYQKASIIGTIQKYTLGLPFVLLRAIRGKPKQISLDNSSESQLILLTADQNAVRGILSQQISLDINDNDGYITLSTNFSDRNNFV